MYQDFIAHRDKQPFENIKNGTKKMEIRLYDEKRQKIKLGDIAKLINRDNENDILFTRIIGLSRFASFEDLYRVLGNRIKDWERDLLSKVYSKEVEEKYGVLAIHFELLDE